MLVQYGVPSPLQHSKSRVRVPPRELDRTGATDGRVLPPGDHDHWSTERAGGTDLPRRSDSRHRHQVDRRRSESDDLPAISRRVPPQG